MISEPSTPPPTMGGLAFPSLICFLSGFTFVRLGDVQTVEIAIVGGYLLRLMTPNQRLMLQGPRAILDLVPALAIMILFVFMGSVLSLRLQMYPPLDVANSILKQPPFTTFARLFEVSLAASSTFIVGLAVQQEPRRFARLLTAYMTCVFVSVGWGFFTLAIYVATGMVITPGVTNLDAVPRITGFFNEGGPFGVFLVSAMIIQVIRGPVLGYVSRVSFALGLATILAAFAFAQSKAAIIMCVFLAIPYIVRTKRVGIIVAGLLLIIPAAITSDLFRQLTGYYESYSRYEEAIAERPDDTTLTIGRLAAAVLLPRMVAQHPYLGVGIGNYSHLRNDPAILEGIPPTRAWDLTGLGLLGYMAELGIPLTMFVMWIYAYPIRKAWASRPWILVLCTYPLCAALFGVQLNFAYPWVVAGLGLAAVAIEREARARVEAVQAAPDGRLPLPVGSPGETAPALRSRTGRITDRPSPQ